MDQKHVSSVLLGKTRQSISCVCVRGEEEVAHFPEVNINEVAHREFLVRSSA